MAKYSNGNFEELNITKSELKEFGEALKKEEFRKLLNEYVDEVTNPENVALYEKEVTQLEKERGVDITFIHPKPGYVIKTSVDDSQKAFINICSNDNVDKPQSTSMIKDGYRGNDWKIPHLITPPKVDLDKKGQRCVVYDVVFHPLTLDIATGNREFKSLVNDTAMSGIEDSFNTKMDRNNIRFPKMMFKGPKAASIIRKKCKENTCPENAPVNIPNYPYEPLKTDRIPKVTKPRRSKTKEHLPIYTIPKYIIKHRKGIDLQEFSNDPVAKMNAAIPSELIIEVDLPLLSSATDALLDVSTRGLSLICEKPSKYKLELNLPYDVNESNGSARFDSKSKKLIVTLPVIKKTIDPSYLSRDDSGIESDPCHNRSSSDEDLSEPKVEVLDSQANPTSALVENLRTKNELSGFFSEQVHYDFPCFKIIKNKNSLCMTLNVKNVDPSTVFRQYFLSESGVQFKFSSLGAGCFPLYYALCIQFPGFVINSSALKVEVWDNNVIINFELSSDGEKVLESYLVGPNIKSLKSERFTEEEVAAIQLTQGEKKEEIEEKLEENTSLITEENNEATISSEYRLSETESAKELSSPSQLNAVVSKDASKNSAEGCPPAKKMPKARAVSESNAHPPKLDQVSRRSILKTSRSLSESHSDEYNWSSLDSTDDSTSPSVKKTVRFSEVISRKVFRANSSILGQKHKNEKKSRNRKKSAERRRHSESEPSLSESEPDASDFSDYSEVSDLSDVSSDGGSDEPSPTTGLPAQLPPSKRHRRRGSKNSRKNAATAKQNSFLSMD